ncbi:MAG: hypothetical protein ACE5GU_15565 [Candidatus Scalinduaceae bacterium]
MKKKLKESKKESILPESTDDIFVSIKKVFWDRIMKYKNIRNKIKKILEEECKISDINGLMQKSKVEKIDSWAALIHKSINEPTMFFIIYVPSNKEEDRKLFIISKEEWSGRYTMLTGKSRKYINLNWFRTLIYEDPIELENGDKIIFATRKNWYKIIIIAIIFALIIFYINK